MSTVLSKELLCSKALCSKYSRFLTFENIWQAPLMARLKIEPSVWDKAWLVAAAAALKHQAHERRDAQEVLQVHLVLDTGLGREGCLRQELLPLAQALD